MCLWDELEPGHRPRFVDLGCGSGVLPFVLNKEGYPGYGVDLRSRPFWEKLEDHSTFLKVCNQSDLLLKKMTSQSIFGEFLHNRVFGRRDSLGSVEN